MSRPAALSRGPWKTHSGFQAKVRLRPVTCGLHCTDAVSCARCLRVALPGLLTPRVGGPRGRCHSRLEHCDRLVFHRPLTQEIAAARASDGSCQASPQGVREGSDGRPRGSEDRPAAAAPLVACWCPRRWARPVRAGRSTRGLCARPHCCRVTCRTLILRVQRLH